MVEMSLASELVVGGCRLGAVIGRGGMGTVYRATQLALGREVAVKVVPAQGVEAGVVERFQREARTAAALEHPHLVPIYAAGEEDGLLYLVMRLVDGADLGAVVARDGPLAARHAVAVIEQVASALDAIHAAALVHRDVKPGNVLIDLNTDRAYLSDYGLMRRALERSAITRTGEWVGTIDYAAPEQLRGAAVGPSADVYALGAVLYNALTGERPFPRGTVSETAQAHATLPPPQIASPQVLNPVIARAMAKAPASRFASAGEFAAAARRAVDRGQGVRRRRLAQGTVGLAAAAAVAAAALALGGGGPHTAAHNAAHLASSTGVTSAFTFEYPSGWRVAESEFPMGTFNQTEVISSDGSASVIIDRTPDGPLSLSAWAAGVEQDSASTPGYRLVSSQTGIVDSRPAVIWQFEASSLSPPARVDIFQRIGSDGYAVLARSGSVAQSLPVATSVARSLRPRS
jgi:serine/threonine protein kinase